MLFLFSPSSAFSSCRCGAETLGFNSLSKEGAALALSLLSSLCLFPVQVRRYDLVIQLSEEGAALGAREMRSSSRDTIRDIEQDMALATALAQVCLVPFGVLLLRVAGLWLPLWPA